MAGNLEILNTTLSLLKERGMRPTKSLGQHFLVNKKDIETILEAAELEKHDTIVEIGPGPGILTLALAQSVHEVHVIEMDSKMIRILTDQLAAKGIHNVELHKGDATKVHLDEFTERPYKIVTNLPYQITSEFFTQMTKQATHMKHAVVMVQKEVAQRLTASPGDMSLLAVVMQLYAEVKMVKKVPKTHFYPAPRVDSAVITIHPLERDGLDSDEREAVIQLAKKGFSSKRKMLKNNLASYWKRSDEWFELAGIPLKARAEELSVEDWISLWKHFKVDLDK